MNSFYDGCCNSLPKMAAGSDLFADLFSAEDIETFVRKVHKGAYKNGSYDKKRVSAYAQVFGQAVATGYGKSLGDADFTSDDKAMMEQLKKNCFHFAAAKNRSEIESLSAALRDANGKLRSFDDFKVEASKILDDYQVAWLRTEYDTAVNAATLAARWTEFEDDDILVFRTVGDSRVRPEHREFEGIALPKSHPFWKTFYPPLAWNCRCTVELSINGRITADKDLPWSGIDKIPPIWRTNLAEAGMAFPPNHPYFSGKSEASLSPFMPKGLKEYMNGQKIEMDPAFWNYFRKEVNFTTGKSSHLNLDTNTVQMRKYDSRETAQRILYHEFGHVLDQHNLFHKNKKTVDVMNKYISFYKGDGFRKLDKQLKEEFEKLTDQAGRSKFVALSDTVMSLNVNYGFGHSRAYFTRQGFYGREREFLAHAFENKFVGNPVFKKFAPELYDDMINLIDDLLKEIK